MKTTDEDNPRDRRRYRSPLRKEAAARTREQILDGLVAVLAKGPAELSVPAVAEAAGASVATVYRHFGSKKGLVDGLFDRYAEKLGVAWKGDAPVDLATMKEKLPEVFRRHGRVDPITRAAMAGAVARKARRADMPRRLEGMDRIVKNTLGDVAPHDALMLRDALVILTSSAVCQAFREYLGLTDEQAAEHAIWVIENLFDAVGSRRGPGGKP